MKKTLYVIILLAFAIISASCDKLGDVLGVQPPPEVQPKTASVTIDLTDDAGEFTKVNFQIIDRVADPAGSFRPNVRYSQSVNCFGSVSYTFNDITPGTFAGLIGSTNETYLEFTIDQGEHITLNYHYHISSYVTIGDPLTGYHTVPNKKWSMSVSKN